MAILAPQGFYPWSPIHKHPTGAGMTSFNQHLQRLRHDLGRQGARCMELTLRAVESYFDGDRVEAADVIKGDESIDRVDVEIERGSINLLAMGETEPYSIRSVLTIVKINNELERIADCAVNVAEVVLDGDGHHDQLPQTFRVMANSVIGMLRDANDSLSSLDIELATRVLQFDDAVDRFKREITLDAQKQVASGGILVDMAFRLLSVVGSLERIADHSTNICEQVIYLETGKIVRHSREGWSEPALPDSDE